MDTKAALGRDLLEELGDLALDLFLGVGSMDLRISLGYVLRPGVLSWGSTLHREHSASALTLVAP